VVKKCERWLSEFGIENWKKVCDSTETRELERTTERIMIRRSEDSSNSDSNDNDTTEPSGNSDFSGVELLDE
jgi:hypothetical protein